MSSSMIFYRYGLNPMMRALLRSPMHGVASRNIGILHFTGRRSGKALNTPLSYMRDGNIVRFLSNTETTWWKNLRGDGVPVAVELQRQSEDGTARVFEGDTEALREHVRQFIAAVPRDAAIYGMKLDENRHVTEDSLAMQAPHLVIVEVTLT